MTIKKLVESIFRGDRADVIGQGADEERKVRKDTKVVDLAHEVLRNRAADDHSDLDALIRMGWPNVKREKFKSKIRKKVWDIVSEDVGAAGSTMVDEITDRIVDVSEADEYYAKIFNEEEA